MDKLTTLGHILLFFIGGCFFIIAGLLTSWLLRPNRPNPIKRTVYECGEETIGNATSRVNIKFYVMAIVFLIFDVEFVLMLPWALSFSDTKAIASNPQWQIWALVEMMIFIVILLLGYVYLLWQGDIGWKKPIPNLPMHKNIVPLEDYQNYNA